MPRGTVYDQIAAMNSAEIEFLASLSARAYQCVVRNVAQVDLRTRGGRPSRRTERDATGERTRRIACVAFDLPYPRRHLIQAPSGEGVLRVLGPRGERLSVCYDATSNDDVRKIAEAMITETREFLESQDPERPIHFVLLNELALSFDEYTRERMLAQWRQIAAEFGTYVVAGSYHCGTEGSNISPLIAPSGATMEIRKQYAAQRQGETIRTPDVKEIAYCKTDFGNAAVWICLDLYDPGLVLKLLSITHRLSPEYRGSHNPGQELHLLLVPAFNRESLDDLQETIASISRFTNTAVFVANSFSSDNGNIHRYETRGSICGELREPQRSERLPHGLAEVYEMTLGEVEFNQAQSFQKAGIYTSQFRAIVTGSTSVVPVPE
jgi:hypothetical protein